jgi:hypothetical protein
MTDLERAVRDLLAASAEHAPGAESLAASVRTRLRRQRRRRVAVAGVALGLAGLAAALGALVVPAGNHEDRLYPAEPDRQRPLVTCRDGGPRFAPAAYEDLAPPDPGSALAKELRARPPIARRSGRPFLPWRLLAQRGNFAYLLGGPQSDVTIVSYLRRNGVWTFYGQGSCTLDGDVGDGLEIGLWRLAGPAPAPTATEVHILVSDEQCNSGAPPGDRVASPVVDYRADAVVITARVHPRKPSPGVGYDCQGNEGTPYVLRLKEPLGARRLLDGRWWPPRPVTAPRG